MAEGNVVGVIFNLFLYIILILSFYNRKEFNNITNRSSLVVSIAVMFCIWPFFSGDYFHYKEMVETELLDNLEWKLESIYIYIIKYVHRNYFLFRIVVWIGGLFLYREALNNFGFFGCNAFSIALLMILPYFAGARAYPAMMIFLFGLSIIFKERYRYSYIVLGALICSTSIFFHKQCAILILIYLISLFFKPTWLKIGLCLIGLTLIVKIFQNYLDLFLLSFERGDEANVASSAGNKLSWYATQDTSYAFSPSGTFNFILTYLPILYSVVYYLNHVSVFEKLPFMFCRFARMLPIFVVIAISITCVTRGFNPLTYRVLNMAYLSLIMLVIYGFKYDWEKKFSRISLLLTIIFYLWRISYQVYCCFMS